MTALVTGRWAKKEIRARSPHHDDGDSQEESETSAVSDTSSESVSIAIGKSFGRLEALRMAARKFEPESLFFAHLPVTRAVTEL